MNSTAIIVQARTGSTRLPGKMLLPFFNNKSILEIILLRIYNEYDNKYKIILATSLNKSDDPIESLGSKIGVPVFRGDENNVLQRFIDAAQVHNIKNIIRVCADNPFLEVKHIQDLINIGINDNFDYVSFQYEDNIPVIKSHIGLFTEFTTINTLKRVNKLTDENIYTEHVTNFIYEHSSVFNLKLLPLPAYIIKQKEDVRFTLDTIEDFHLLKKLYFNIGEKNISDLRYLFKHIDANPDISEKMKEQIKLNSK